MTSEQTHTTEHAIDARGKRVGHLATDIAMKLMGKDTPAYAPNKVADTRVTVSGASNMNISERKRTGEIYKRYSGHPGGQKIETMEKLIERTGYAEVLRRAVYGMLPANKLRKERMKNLIIEE